MTATVPSRLDRVAELAQQLGRRPSSNEVRSLVRCGRETANGLLAELDRLMADGSPDVASAVAERGPREIAPTGADQQPTTGPQADGAEPVGPSPVHRWPLILLALPAFVAIWSGWVGLGTLTGFGPVHPLPGIAGGFTLNTAITLPIGVETYAAYALRVWLAGNGTERARRFAKWSAIGSLVLGALGQVAYHLMTAHHITSAPWPITTAVACLPVIVLGCGAGLLHLVGEDNG